MSLSRTLSFYIGRQFVAWFAIMFLTIVAMVVLIDAVELLRRFSNQPEATFAVITSMTLLRAPSRAQEALPFAVMFGAIFTFLRLTRTHELVAVRAAGISVWQFLLPAVITAMFIGFLNITLFNPLSALLLSHYEALEGKYLTGRSSMLAVSSSGIWLRQSGEGRQQQAVIHATKVKPDSLELEHVIVFEFEGNDRFTGRVDAETAKLTNGYWEFTNAWLTAPNRAARYLERHALPTDLTADKIQESFASPETVSFWELPRFIQVLNDTGFSATAHRLQFHTLLAKPVLLAAMVLVAAPFSLRLTRRGGTLALLAAGVLVAFALFLLTNVIQALGLGASVPVVLSAWAPAGVAMMAGLTMLMHLEDG